jgi:hypothetical protein
MLVSSRDQMVVMLGPYVNTSRPPLPNPEAAQTSFARDPLAFHTALQESLTADSPPSKAHTFLAELPKKTEAIGDHKECPLIVTANYDTLLEKAFQEAKEEYDLAIYMATGDDQTKFVHIKWDSTEPPEPIDIDHDDFPFNDDMSLRRTLIVKVHGAVTIRDYGWDNNFVITEDNYIDYLTGGPIDQLVPKQIHARLNKSHPLFLGYDIRDWNLRVFLKRIWKSPPGIQARSWAVQENPDELQKQLWTQTCGSYLTLFDEPVDQYIEGLDACLRGSGD